MNGGGPLQSLLDEPPPLPLEGTASAVPGAASAIPRSLACEAGLIALRAVVTAAETGNVTCRMALYEIMKLPWPKP